MLELRAVVFVLASGAMIYAAYATGHVLLMIPLVYVALSFMLVGLGYGFMGPRIFLKQADGTLATAGYVLLWPVHAINWASLGLFRLIGRESAFNEITEGILLGCRPIPTDRGALEACGVTAVLDLTCEFAESRFLRDGHVDYLTLPVLDASAPTLAQLNRGVRFIQGHLARHGAVYVHCALGHGRSATFVAACLLAAGVAQSPHDAHAILRRKRPGVGLHRPQMAVLRVFADQRPTLWSLGREGAA